MKKRNILGIGLLTSLLVASAAFLLPAQLKQAKAASEPKSPYTISETNYEVAFLEQFNGGEPYGYVNDKPISELNSLAGHLYGNYDDALQVKLEHNLQGGVNETLKWVFSGVKSKNKNGLTYVQLENSKSKTNICNAEQFPEADFPNEYAIGQILTAEGYKQGAVMYTKDYIDSVLDFQFYWRSSYTQKIFILYQIEGQDWQVLSKKGNVAGDRGWDANGYSTFESSSWAEKELCHAKARLGIACTEAPEESGSMPINAVCINADYAAVRYLNVLSYQDNMCSGETGYNLNLGEEQLKHNQDLFKLATEKADADNLAAYSVLGSKTKETTALGLYNHFVESIPELGDVKGLAVEHVANSTTYTSSSIVAIAVIASVALVAVTAVVVTKKIKHN